MSLLLFLIVSVTSASLHTYATPDEEGGEEVEEEEVEEEEVEEEEVEEEEVEEEEVEEEEGVGQISSFQEECDPGQHYDLQEEECVPDVSCDPGQHYDLQEEECVPDVSCDPGQHYDLQEEECVPDLSQPEQVKLTVGVDVTNDNGGQKQPSDFNIKVAGTSNPSPAEFQGASQGSEVTLGTGDYEVTEITQDPNYQITSSGDCNGTIDATGITANDLTCTIEMDDKQLQPEQVKLTVGVDVTNDNGGQKQPSDFNIKVAGTSNPSPAEFQGASQGSEVTLGTGDYEVTEITQDPNYQITSSGDCNGNVGDGEVNVSTTPITKSLTCIIGIDDKSPPPVAKDDRAVTGPNSGVKINVLNNDRATVDGTTLSVISVSESQNGGNIIINSDDTITYNNPNSNFRGEDRFNYEVAHLIPGSTVSRATATVTVGEQPIIRTCGDIEVTVIKHAPETIKIDCDRPKENFDCYDINIDDSQVDSSNWKNDHTVTYKPDPNRSADSDSFRYELTCWWIVG